MSADGSRWDVRLADAAALRQRPALDEEAWRAAVDPYDTGAWTRRLEWAGLGPVAFGEDEDHRSADWAVELTRIRAALQAAAPAVEPDAGDIPFAHLLSPVVHATWQRVSSAPGCGALAPSACADLRRALLRRLSDVSSQTLGERFAAGRTLADVVVARIADGAPAGASSERYRRFCEEQASHGLASVLAGAPVLGRLLATSTLQWAEATEELIERLAGDRGLLRESFGIEAEDPIVSIATGLSDLHLAGRGVAIVEFGSGRRLVYKPRPVEIEALFQDVLAVVSEAPGAAPLRRLEVLHRGGYGYVEHVEHRCAADAEALRRFYGNAGRLLALLYLLGATDCHWENLIAAGDQLVLVDAETLFEGTPRMPSETARADREASDHIADSVLRTGMLPSWLSVGPARAIDISALGAPAPHGDPALRPAWCFVNTDDMVWGERTVERAVPACLPVPPGCANPLAEHEEELVDGFRDACAAFAARGVRERLRAAVRAFRGARRRIVVRPTRTYALVQHDALTPLALRTADERALRLERLARAYLVERERPPSWALLHHEIASMERLDVPYFEGVVGSSALYAGDEVVVGDYYEKEGLAESLSRLDLISPREVEWQVRLMRGAIAAHRFEMAPSHAATSLRSAPAADAHDASEITGAHAASDVVDLITSAKLDAPSGPPTWLTVALMADATRVQLGLVPPGLYDGRAGIAAFLHDCGEDAFAKAVMQPVLDALQDDDSARVRRFIRDVGPGMSGVGGILRLFAYRAGDGGAAGFWWALAERVAAALSDDLLRDCPTSDLVSGIGGLAAPVAALHAAVPSDASARVLTTIGTLLLERQDAAGAWALAPGHPPLAGLSHGASGIATALAHAAVSLRDERFADAAAHALRYEAGLFDSDARNWPDLRKSAGPIGDRLLMRSWCHGSVGIALARVRLLELLEGHAESQRWRDELEIAVDASIEADPTPVDHLCCGNLGRAVVIAAAGQAIGDARWEAAGHSLAAGVLAAAGEHPERYRLLLGIDGASGVRLPGLMTGLAGIGMYLRHGADLRWVRCLLL